MASGSVKPTHFRTQVSFRAWLKQNHAREAELWIGYYKKSSGKGGMVYKEALDEALCFGWIDGIVKSLIECSSQGRRIPQFVSPVGKK